METNKLKTYIQSTNVNFLLGSGLSKPYLSTLGDIEKWLTKLARDTEISDGVRKITKASIYREYFTKVMLPNHTVSNSDNYKNVIGNYKDFLSIWNDIINKRANRLLSKQVNIYTTNIDTLIENVTDEIQIEFNDGFKGSIKQIFDESNFQKSYNKTSLHFQNISEIPVFNLLKMHGSINWKEKNEKIINDYTLEAVNAINAELQKIKTSLFIEIFCSKCKQNKQHEQLLADAQSIVNDNPGTNFNEIFQPFLDLYEKLIIVNPTKQKFVESVTDLHFYELMRMYSNSLEKENSILFVMGFSFADEHIRKITLRAANTNPTLLIVIFAFGEEDTDEESHKNYKLLTYKNNNNNIIVITPSKFKENNKIEEENSFSNFDLKTINSVFSLINNQIPKIHDK